MGQGPPGPEGLPGKSGSIGWKELEESQKTELINKLKTFKDFKGPQGEKGDQGDLTFDFLKRNSLWCADGNICTVPKKLVLPKLHGFDKSVIQIGTDNQEPLRNNIYSLAFGNPSRTFTGMGIIPNGNKMLDSRGSIFGTQIKNGDEWSIYSTNSSQSDNFNNLFSIQSETGKVRIKGPLELQDGTILGKNNILVKINNNDIIDFTSDGINISGNIPLYFN